MLLYHQMAFIGTLVAVLLLGIRAKRLCATVIVPRCLGFTEPSHELDSSVEVLQADPMAGRPQSLIQLDTLFDANEISIEEYVEQRRLLVLRNGKLWNAGR